ncbi:MAG TPA: DNA methyltransferase [Nocardioides sp.]|nr:DNA methyltransferase [Nocardioides sp.]
MIPYYADDGVTLYHGDCVDVLRELDAGSVDAVVTDPPYGLEFMGKDWGAPWKSSGAVIKDPAECGGFQDGNGGNSYSRSRIRYGRGNRGQSAAFGEWCGEWSRECLRVLKPGAHMLAFGGSRTWHRLACAVEDAGFEIRDSIAWLNGHGFPKSMDVAKAIDGAASATPDGEHWQGWGTALKPGFEPIVVARKPLVGSVAANVLAHGTGALNIDGCRVGGRWPANAVLDEDQADVLDNLDGDIREGPSRFFYVAKPDSAERPRTDGAVHPTVKPLSLMRWLVRLVTPPEGLVLEPFAGSGTTIEACLLEGFSCIAIEREDDYLPLIVQRVNRRRDPVAAVLSTGEDPGLFSLLESGA